MFFDNDYSLAWASYLGGFAVLLAVFWYITRSLPWPQLRYGLRLLLAVALLTPWYSSTQGEYLSPAWLMSLFEGIFENNFRRAGAPLMAAVLVSFVLFLISCIIHWYFLGRSPSPRAAAAKVVRKAPTMGEARTKILRGSRGANSLIFWQ